MRVTHEDGLLSLQSFLIELWRVLAAGAGACWSAEPIIGEALAVELKTLRFATITWFDTLLFLRIETLLMKFDLLLIMILNFQILIASHYELSKSDF